MKLRLTLMLFIFLIFKINTNAETVKVEIVDGFPNKSIKNIIEKNASELLNSLEISFTNKTDSVSFRNIQVTREAKETINTIWGSSKFRCVKENIKETLLKSSSGYEIRNIPVTLDSLQEEIVLAFNVQGEVSDVFFSVSQHQYKNVTTRNAVIDETRKNIIRDFLETLKTAYMKKDADFIDMVLSDKALIIVGKTVKQTDKKSFKITDTSKHTLYNEGSNSTYKRMTKTEYINGLRGVFRKNKNILVNYNDIEILPHRKSGYESFYGVRLKQKWQADNYSDYGILFFVIQFRENDNPLIWVRVWQDAHTTPASEQIGMGEIQIQPN